MNHRFIGTLTMLFAIAALPALAQELVLTPDCPSPDQTIAVAVHAGGPAVTWIAPDPLAVDVQGRFIKISAQITNFSLPPPSPTMRTTLGPLAAGTYTVTVVGLEPAAGGGFKPEVLLASRTIESRLNPPACTPAKISIAGATFRQGLVGHAYSDPIRVQVLDDQQRPVKGVEVRFARTSFVANGPAGDPDVAFAPAAMFTDDNGFATSQATANTNAGTVEYAAYYFRDSKFHRAFFVLSNRQFLDAALLVPVVEYYNIALNHYFITANADEMAALDNGVHAGWVRTHNVFLAYRDTSAANGALPVCRFYGLPQAGPDSHFFSADAAECARVMAQWPNAWQLETSNAFRVFLPNLASGTCPSNTQPVYRLYNNRADANHRYTTSLATRAQMVITGGWISEGYGPLGVALCATP